VFEALLLDVGRVVMDVTPAAVDAYEAATGTRAPGPDPPDDDPDGSDYHWDRAAREAGFDGVPGLFRTMAEVVPDAMFDRHALALMRDARAAGRRVGVLSNDSYTFVGKPFFVERPEFAELDCFLDSTEIGTRKPDPEAYAMAAGALAVRPDQVVFLDDTHENVDGSVRVGMAGILVDPSDRMPAFDRARQLLDLRPREGR
jgi:FMN phosphatase YigB (HAD superfamily)